MLDVQQQGLTTEYVLPDNTTALLLYYIYDVGCKFWDSGYAAALTLVLLVILAAFAMGQFLFFDRRVHYQ